MQQLWVLLPHCLASFPQSVSFCRSHFSPSPVFFIKQNQFFLSEPSPAPSLFNNHPLFNEFCYVHRGQRRGANLWFSHQIRSEKVVKIKEAWGKIMPRAHMTSCSSPPRFHDTHRRETLYIISAAWGVTAIPSRHFGSIHWKEKSQKSSSEGHRCRDKEECWWNHMRFMKFLVLGWSNEAILSVTAAKKVKGGDGFQTGTQTFFVDGSSTQTNSSRK